LSVRRDVFVYREITAEQIEAFYQHLQEDEREPATIRKYLRDVAEFAAWLERKPVCKEAVIRWKEHLQRSGQQPVTVNGKLSALNRFFAFAGWPDCRVKHLRIQRRMFRSTARDLTREDYTRLVETAQAMGRERLALLIETICATGIRVSEVRYITVEAAQTGQTTISLKGKLRTILLPGKLCRKLLKYARKRKIASGEVFLTRSGKGLGRRQIWAEMKALCSKAGVERS
jgi:site-specific recombinase XerD